MKTLILLLGFLIALSSMSHAACMIRGTNLTAQRGDVAYVPIILSQATNTMDNIRFDLSHTSSLVYLGFESEIGRCTVTPSSGKVTIDCDDVNRGGNFPTKGWVNFIIVRFRTGQSLGQLYTLVPSNPRDDVSSCSMKISYIRIIP